MGKIVNTTNVLDEVFFELVGLLEDSCNRLIGEDVSILEDLERFER